jgi:exodeoxyribonuclease VII small subunit
MRILSLARRAKFTYIHGAMAKKNQTAPRSFEEALAELEQIVSAIEGGQVGLEESLVRYERGTFLIQHCRGVLGAAEKQIELLSKTSEGGLASVPMDAPEADTKAE